jgi:hypothetical protein
MKITSGKSRSRNDATDIIVIAAEEQVKVIGAQSLKR